MSPTFCIEQKFCKYCALTLAGETPLLNKLPTLHEFAINGGCQRASARYVRESNCNEEFNRVLLIREGNEIDNFIFLVACHFVAKSKRIKFKGNKGFLTSWGFNQWKIKSERGKLDLTWNDGEISSWKFLLAVMWLQ